ncbi:MAG: hypothetical protein ABI910_16755 [Gemmatimonadota bacterium]
MSEPEQPETTAFRQLDLLVRHLGEELSGFRRRALAAESRVRVLETALHEGGDAPSLERLRMLETENADLRARVAFAAERTQQLLSRVHFLRQQQGRPIPAAPPSSSSSPSLSTVSTATPGART